MATSVKARFADTDSQLKAKDVLQRQLGDDYVVALNLLPRSPHWLASSMRCPCISAWICAAACIF